MKRFFMGIIVGIILTSSFAVFAANGKMIEAIYSIKDIKINGVSKMPKGEKLQPFVYQGSTFVPLRFVSENLGYLVEWDGATNSILIDEKSRKIQKVVYPGDGIKNSYLEGAEEKTGWLQPLTWYEETINGTLFDLYGQEYDRYIYITSTILSERSTKVQFKLDGEYDQFATTIGYAERKMENFEDYIHDKFMVQFYVDGVLTKTIVVKKDEPYHSIQIPLANADTFEIVLERDVTNNGFGFFNPEFIKFKK
ncbi:copper amine oxidase N-terminal domain-containing protein [Rubeoparvulum massiliense]|uniref:copper amine oxidase N-terminal domain-containing protein n=1 Tax=Rubeoparvulum massiliense TaxID=1631346 RepID=UPI00065E8241|nr:copper amine oxidase N-terminal domain-containing protein [Rubeoparvulum massiliense]